MSRLSRNEKKQVIAAVIYAVLALVLVAVVSALAEQISEPREVEHQSPSSIKNAASDRTEL